MKKDDKVKTLAEKVFDGVGDLMGYLCGRWMDEREYEDFSDYEKAMKSEVEKFDGATFVKGTKRPFGFHFKADSKLYEFTMKQKGRYLECEYKRIG